MNTLQQIFDKKFSFLCWLIGGMPVCIIAACLEGTAQDIAGVIALVYVFGGLTVWLTVIGR